MIATIMVYRFTNLSRQEVDAMLGLQLADTRVYREAKEEGRQEGEFAPIVRQLKRRIGSIDEALESRIQHLSVEQLELLGEALLDFSELNDLVLWLNRHCP
jgi:predicted transposase YdaD